MTKQTCPLCSHLVLRHTRPGGLYWFCRHCHQEVPVYQKMLAVEAIDRQMVLQNRFTPTSCKEAPREQAQQKRERVNPFRNDCMSTPHKLHPPMISMKMALQMLEIASNQTYPSETIQSPLEVCPLLSSLAERVRSPHPLN